MRILYVTTIGITLRFFESIIASLLQDGHEVQVACNDRGGDVPAFYHEHNIKIHRLDCTRSPLRFENLQAVRQIEKIVAQERFDIVHCHTPIAAMCTRLACRRIRKNGTKVIYTAHGFHFYRGAPLTNWLVFYPIEKLCSRFTDVLITINKEDYALAQAKMRACKTAYIPGVGIDTQRIASVCINRADKREKLGIPKDAFLLLSVGELNANKNHEMVIRALGDFPEKHVHYAIAGCGELAEHLKNVAIACGVQDRVHLLGFRRDVYELLQVADIYVHPSFREGLPVSVMEAMASGLPIVCSKIRGNVDIVEDQTHGVWFSVKEMSSLHSAIGRVFENQKDGVIGKNNREDAQKYDYREIQKSIYSIYFETDGKE